MMQDSFQGRLILVVDDEPMQRETAEEVLTSLGYHVLTAPNGHRAEAILREREVDLVLLDLNLPDSAGLDTFRSVHRHAMHLPIVILSGQDDVELAVDAVSLGAQDYLTKGEANRSSLARSIRYAIERSRRQRAEQELTAAGEEG